MSDHIVTERINQIVFPAATLYIAGQDKKKFTKVKDYETYLLTFASLSYLSMLTTTNPYDKLNVRYLDWLLTTPLLTGVVYEYAAEINPQVRKEIPGEYLYIFPILMIITGYLARSTTNKNMEYLFLALSWLFLVLTLYYIYRISQLVNLHAVEWFFYILWPLYGLVYFIDDIDQRTNLYNVLDFFAKVVFAIYFTNIVLAK